MQDSQLASQPNTTHYIYPYDTHMQLITYIHMTLIWIKKLSSTTMHLWSLTTPLFRILNILRSLNLKSLGGFCFLFLVGFFFAFPSYISGVHHFWVRFLRMCPFFNPTIKVVTFRLRGWCVLGVFFVAGIHPSRTWTSGSLESMPWSACVHRLDLGLYSHPKEFLGEWSWNPC